MTKKRFCRSLLFVPADRVDRYAKALNSGADMICIDLEDAVSPEKKEGARQQAINYVLKPSLNHCEKALRINELSSAFGIRDLLALSELDKLPDYLLLPKVSHPREIQIVRDILGEKANTISFFALLETSEGIGNAVTIAAENNVDFVMFGSADWAAQCGADTSWDTLLTPRSMVVQAAAHVSF